MDLSKVRLVSEQDSHFELHDGASGFTVAKKGLSKSLQDKIRKMQPVATKAVGGEQPLESLPEDAPVLESLPDQAPAFTPPPLPMLPPLPLEDSLQGPYKDRLRADQSELEKTGLVPTTEKLVTGPFPAAPATPAPPPEESMQDMLKRLGMDALIQRAAGAGVGPVKVPTVAIPPAEPSKIEILDVAAKFKEAKQKEAEATLEEGKARAKEQQDLADYLKTALVKNEQDADLAQAEYEKAKNNQARLSKMAEEFKIDPDAYFGNMTTGSKIATILSLAAGGFAQGYSGGRIPNYAAEAFDKAIERDIASQMQRKDSIYKQFLAATNDTEKASALARAKTQEIAAMKLTQLGAQSKSEVFKRAADTMAAQVNANALVGYSTVLQNQLSMEQAKRMAPIQEQAAKLGLQAQATGIAATKQSMLESAERINQARAAARAQLDVAAETQAQKQLVDAMATGPIPMTGAQVNALPDPVRKRAVQIQPNKWTLAVNEEDANKIKEFLPASRDVKQYVSAMLDYAKESTIPGTPFPTAKAREMEALSSRALIAINKASGLGALDKGSKELLETLVTPPTDFFAAPWAVESKLETVLKTFESAETNFLNSRLMMPQKASAMTFIPEKTAQAVSATK